MTTHGQSNNPDDDLRDYLLTQPTPWLVDQLLRASEEAPAVRAALVGTARSATTPDLPGAVAAPTGHLAVQYRAELGALDDLLARDLALPAVDGLERLIERLEEALGRVPDPGGEIHEVLAAAQLLHAKASQQAHQEPAELGVHLANWALSSDWDVFLESPTTHAESLGPDGLDSFETVVDGYFSQLPPLGAGQQDQYGAKPTRFVVTHLKRQLAARRGTDAVLEVMSRDLSSADRFAEVAQVLTAAGREAEALVWLGRGAAPGRPSTTSPGR